MKSTNIKNKTVICYGEVLWDIFPHETKPGGAPMNVAYHLKKFGIDSKMISRVGTDQQGTDLLNFLKNKGISTSHCQIDEKQPTGVVNAIEEDDHEMKYEIKADVSWDNITLDQYLIEAVKKADAFVFGTLSTRSETSRQTLYELLNNASYKIFDINLRPPFYSQEIIERLLHQCNLLKLNQSELQLVGSWFKCNNASEEKNCVRTIQETFNIDEVIVTKGSNGATYYDKKSDYSFPANKVIVKDTVGSGDSFLAAFLAKKIQNESIETAMSYATSLGAYVTSQEGACPEYELEELLETASDKI